MNKLKSLFEHKCPKCGGTLTASYDSISSSKSCPACSYKEEIHAALGVRIIHDPAK
ncbi:hypothetical protein [Paenibacillus sp. J22TS3]|uniref:hypothetical protein n=1 Tax=Paenibacillus sp. J22TS3 TaxID=2807192 RepID=UPI001B253311|nr:hypothetical protein [Paenibacillus sp. J22TS3]GIP23777.1 hypothetical protein J22TS3_40520 [Paenibacillus sp. J22TS3]